MPKPTVAETGDDASGGCGGERQVTGAAARIQNPVTGPDDCLRGEPAPALVEPRGHHAVHQVVDRRDPVEHALDAFRRKCSGPYAHALAPGVATSTS